MIWLCYDREENTWVAVRILKGELSVEDGSAYDRHKLFRSATRGVSKEEFERAHILVSRNVFWEGSPNGVHKCFVLPLLGPPIDDISQHLLEEFLPAVIKHRCYQFLQALDFLHERDLCLRSEYQGT